MKLKLIVLRLVMIRSNPDRSESVGGDIDGCAFECQAGLDNRIFEALRD